MNYKSGTNVEVAGVYWCTVCKTPAAFEQGNTFPPCPNLCSKGHWHLVRPAGETPKPA
ncbi:MAG: hypothetical protein NTY38_11820 [Acidobacteria bacterium]|nr:hypothetical protein [Acidobacteriota bacterium]